MEEVLEKLGLSKNESKIYIALLGLGPAVVHQIAEKSNVNRTNAYDILKRLIEKGLVSYFHLNDKKYFEANNPENLINVLKEKELRLKNILPQIRLNQKLTEYKGEAHIHKGLTSAKNIMAYMLGKKEPIYVYGIIKDIGKLAGPFFSNFHKRRIAAKVWMYHIYNTDAKERINFLKDMAYTEVKILSREFDSPVATNICGDEVIFIIWRKDALIIQIQNKEIAEAYKKYFDLLWKIAKKA